MYNILKRFFDIVISLCFLPLIFFFYVILYCIILTEDRGDVFYVAKRRGYKGKIFNMYKFRTMIMNAPDIRNEDNSTFNSMDDARLTKWGRILRKTSIDELPQFINVLKGDMSIVGPRPVTIDRPLSEYDRNRWIRLHVKPGITGYTQAYFRNSICQEEKFEKDAWYAQNASFFWDCKIFIQTIRTVFKRKNIYANSELREENSMKKKLLILGAGRGQVKLYQAAKDLHVHTIAGTLPGENLPCMKLADEVFYMDISEVEESMDKLSKSHLEFDGVATCCMDTGMKLLGRICDEKKLTGVTGDVAILCNDKLDMKEALSRYSVNTAAYMKISERGELEEVFKRIGLPVVIKAVDLQGSKGVYICRTREEAQNAFSHIMELTGQSYCIAEEFLEGVECGAQAFVYKGEILFIMPHGDEVYFRETGIPVGHYVPYDAPEAILQGVKMEAKKAIQALGLDNCAVNMDFIVRDGKVYVIELTGRAGANGLCELVEGHFGVEYYKMIVLAALGETPLEYWKKRKEENLAVFSRMIISEEKSGFLKGIRDDLEDDPEIEECIYFKKPGDEIKIFESSNDCIGQIVVKSNQGLEACRNKIKAAMDSIELEV